MKKHITLLVLTLFAVRTFAQDTIPNPSFERWTQGTGYEDPTGWTTPNSLTVGAGGVAEVTKTDTEYSGSFAARLETQQLLIPHVDTSNVPGFVILGSLAINPTTFTGSITGGIPFNGRPDTLYGYYRYTPASGKTDSCLVFVILTHWNKNVIPNKRDTVVAGAFESGVTLTTYTRFAVDLAYQYFPSGGEIPDTMQLGILSSYKFLNNPPVGSVMFVDSLYFSTDSSIATGVNSLTNKGFSISCYPNPANTNLNILISEPQPGMEIKVYDALGRDILTLNNEGLITSIDVSKLSSGVYFYEVLDNNGNSLKTNKFTVVR